ncbi:MAG: hypothetical protein GY882_04345 [Actinomycetia bacterium]|nr:hypothetical protein [Actinomycetes bacterium]
MWASFSDLGEAQANNAVAVVFCESSLRPSSTNVNGGGSKDYGLWQFNDGGTLQGVFADVEGREPGPGEAEAVALDIGWNLAAGRTLFDQRGWRPWACASKVGVTTRLWGSTPGASWGALPDIS